MLIGGKSGENPIVASSPEARQALERHQIFCFSHRASNGHDNFLKADLGVRQRG